MTDTDLPTPETLRKLLSYDPDTGLLTWKRRPIEMFPNEWASKSWNTKFCGKHAFLSDHSKGYKQGMIFNKLYLAHRVVYAIYYGIWPTAQIDHINGDKLDNRIANLRDVTNAENARNTKKYSNNTSGYTGVSWDSTVGKWRSSIWVQNKNCHLGFFTDIEDAIASRASANIKYDYHANHGRPQPLA